MDDIVIHDQNYELYIMETINLLLQDYKNASRDHQRLLYDIDLHLIHLKRNFKCIKFSTLTKQYLNHINSDIKILKEDLKFLKNINSIYKLKTKMALINQYIVLISEILDYLEHIYTLMLLI